MLEILKAFAVGKAPEFTETFCAAFEFAVIALSLMISTRTSYTKYEFNVWNEVNQIFRTRALLLCTNSTFGRIHISDSESHNERVNAADPFYSSFLIQFALLTGFTPIC